MRIYERLRGRLVRASTTAQAMLEVSTAPVASIETGYDAPHSMEDGGYGTGRTNARRSRG